jgi:MFS family permease
MTSINPPSSPSRLHYGLVVLSLIVLAVFGALGLGRFGYTSILPAMETALKLTKTETGELQSWNLAGYLVTVVFAGLLAARFGPRLVISISLIIAGAGMALTGIVPTFEGARAGRFLAGVGGAGANVPAMALVSSWFGARRRGLATGLGVGGSSIGLMVTGPLIPFILERHGPQGWRVCWYVLGAMALVVCVLCALFLRNRPEEKGLTPLGESSEEQSRRGAEKRASSLDWSLVYRSWPLWYLAVIYFAFGFSYIIYSTYFIRHLTGEGGFTKETAGLLWFGVGMVSIISGFIWGTVSDRWGRRLALLAVFALQGTSFLIMGLSLDLRLIYLSAGLFAITAWSIPALMAALSGDIFGARLAPAALGLMTIIFGAGQVLGPYFAGKVAHVTSSYSPAFLTAGLVAWILGAGGTFLLRPSQLGAATVPKMQP